MAWDIIYSYEWEGRYVQDAYTVRDEESGHPETQSGHNCTISIKREIAKKLYEESGVVLCEPGTTRQVPFGRGNLQTGASLGLSLIHI